MKKKKRKKKKKKKSLTVVTFFLRAPDGTISQTFTLITVISLVKHSALHVELIVVSTV